ncbi:MAG: SIMPL domain-containing protein [Firmicutes bacterium]|nr:SIMPL domain-containing protein [Bacillota bacterium]
MKGIMRIGVVVCLLVLGLSLFAVAADKPELRLITVTGDAEVRVVPDEIVINMGVETWDKDLGTAKKLNDTRVKKVLALAKEYKIDPKYIQTGYISVEPKYARNDEERKLIGYFVNKTIVVTLKDISRFEDFLSNILESGVNYVYGIQLQTTELRKYRDQARAMAIKAAKEKAVALAGELGQKVGKPYAITEEYSGGYYQQNFSNMSQNASSGAGSSESEGSIALGQITVRARVTVSFELE